MVRRMARVDFSGILREVNKVIAGATTETGGMADEAGKRFREILEVCILRSAGVNHANGELGPTAVEELMDIAVGKPYSSSPGVMTVPISFPDGGERMSLDPKHYGGVSDIVEILNYGYSARGVVSGTWHGQKAKSLAHRRGAHFIEDAIRIFMDGEAKKYGVKRIRVAMGESPEYY